MSVLALMLKVKLIRHDAHVYHYHKRPGYQEPTLYKHQYMYKSKKSAPVLTKQKMKVPPLFSYINIDHPLGVVVAVAFGFLLFTWNFLPLGGKMNSNVHRIGGG